MECKIDTIYGRNKILYIAIELNEDIYDYLCYDYEISKKISITTKQYQEELKKFGAYKYRDMFFKERCHAYKALQYLKEKYDVLLKLTN